jgi:transcriptional regulator with XRE-family HTH domain
MVSYLQRIYQEAERRSGGMHIARKFEALLDKHRHPDGRKWTGAELAEATGGLVHRSYVTNLRKGRIESPGYDKLKAVAKAMGFPPELWFSDYPLSEPEAYESGDHDSIAERLEHLFASIPDERTGQPYTNEAVARESAGAVTEEEVAEIRSGELPDPSVDHVLSLAEVFGVPASYFLERERKPPIISPNMIEASKDETVTAILNKSLRLPEREKQMVLNIIKQFEEMHGAQDGS